MNTLLLPKSIELAEKKEAKRKITKQGLKRSLRIFKYLTPYKAMFSAGMALLLLSTFAGLIVPILLGQMAGAGLDNNPVPSMRNILSKQININDINTLFVILIGLFLIQAVIGFLRVYTFAWFTEKMMLALRKDVYNQIIRMPMDFFNQKRVGDLNSRVSSDVTTIQETFTTTLAEFIRQILTIIFGVTFLFYLSSSLTFLMLATIPVVVVSAVIFGRYIRKLSKQTQEKISESNVIIEETLTAITAVKAFANEAYESLRYGQKADSVRGLAMKNAIWRGFFSSFILIFLFGAVSFVIWQGLKLKESGQIDAGIFMQFLLLTAMIGGSFGGLASQYSSMQRGIGSIEDVMDILDLVPEDISLEEKKDMIHLQGDIAFKNVSFTYESRPDIPVLKSVSFEAKAGQQVALVGPSGAGKSTLASLILQFYKPSDGHITFDGKNSENYTLSDLRDNMALVPQEVILFGGTIKENIAYGKPGSSDEEIRKAAEQANALEFIDKFPEGLETIVGERGVQLSGGQRQRIAIARAVLKNPTILILDEATSSLDSESERLVQEALDKLMQGRTSIVIAHRLSTIRKADNILVMEHGELKEQGSHQELVALENGVYRHLSDLQLA